MTLRCVALRCVALASVLCQVEMSELSFRQYSQKMAKFLTSPRIEGVYEAKVSLSLSLPLSLSHFFAPFPCDHAHVWCVWCGLCVACADDIARHHMTSHDIT